MKPFYHSIITIILTTYCSVALSQEPTPPVEPLEESPPQTEELQPKRLDSKVARNRSPANTHKAMEVLAQHLPNAASVWLETEHGPFLAIWQKDRSGDAEGAVLILHAEGEHPTWPQTTQPLHNTLPDYGWATMAISLPDLKSKPLPSRTFPVKSTINADTENKQAISTEQENENSQTTNFSQQNDPEFIAEERLNSALKFLHDQGQFNIVLMGNGIGSIRAHDFLISITPEITDEKLKEKFEKPIRALIFFNARNKKYATDEAYDKWFFDPEIPVLDIFTRTDRRNLIDAKSRKILSKQKKAVQYSQVSLTRISQENNWGENRLSRRIRSFLDAYVKGIEIENVRIK